MKRKNQQEEFMKNKEVVGVAAKEVV